MSSLLLPSTLREAHGRESAFPAKGGVMAAVERDAGFCSDDDEDLHSPTDASEDSVEVKVLPICSKNKNKRKCLEPRKVSCGEDIKKRRVKRGASPSPFRPWSLQQEEPLALVLDAGSRLRLAPDERRPRAAASATSSSAAVDLSASRTLPGEDRLQGGGVTKFSVESLLGGEVEPTSSAASTCSEGRRLLGQQRNYKNMTRERRIEANARERTRVHTISAAFDTLRRSIPAYSHNQKLSKLSVLRIACSYILTLSRVAGEDYSADQSEPALADCVDLVSRTIQTEGKLRKKRDE